MPPSFADRRAATLRQRTIEPFGLPGDRCPDPACRRQGRCRSSAPQEPECLRYLSPPERTFYKRLLGTCVWADNDPLHFLGHYIRGAGKDPYLALVGEIVRRAQPRGHWLHAALPAWHRMATGHRATVSLHAAAQTPARYY